MDRYDEFTCCLVLDYDDTEIEVSRCPSSDDLELRVDMTIVDPADLPPLYLSLSRKEALRLAAGLISAVES